jgi:hypothetical protein
MTALWRPHVIGEVVSRLKAKQLDAVETPDFQSGVFAAACIDCSMRRHGRRSRKA